ncbi:MAG: LytTR family DNA-binding domain-containing protein [Bacteroidia bacterium]|nr:LytTR family DNA-binding domain-containing protein [Bacteroidia bacterium]MDW8158644.1 LytTR family DNA-binding domain-containing protein [Bacteroidia bacterium]
MYKLKALVAEDEAPARSKMTRLLSEIEDIELINISSNGNDAYDNILLLKPDVVFLDIEMPGMSGIEIAQNLPPEIKPYIIFTTAYNEHAIKAFEINAIDYLLKPFSLERLKQAVERVKKNFPPSKEEVQKKEEVLAQIATELELPSNFCKIPVPAADRYKLIDYEDVVCLEVKEKVTYIYTLNKEYTINQPLEHFEKKLPSNTFLRVSRSAIINLHAIREVVLWFGNRYKIVLSNNMEVICSRERSKLLKQLIKF